MNNFEQPKTKEEVLKEFEEKLSNLTLEELNNLDVYEYLPTDVRFDDLEIERIIERVKSSRS